MLPCPLTTLDSCGQFRFSYHSIRRRCRASPHQRRQFRQTVLSPHALVGAPHLVPRRSIASVQVEDYLLNKETIY